MKMYWLQKYNDEKLYLNKKQNINQKEILWWIQTWRDTDDSNLLLIDNSLYGKKIFRQKIMDWI